VKCEGPSPRRRCVYASWLCDGDNDCGNNWDENAEVCGKFGYLAGYVCCLHYLFFFLFFKF